MLLPGPIGKGSKTNKKPVTDMSKMMIRPGPLGPVSNNQSKINRPKTNIKVLQPGLAGGQASRKPALLVATPGMSLN
jgi:hypothetical protein